MQSSFFDPLEARLLEISQHNDPLERLNHVIDWQLFNPVLAQINPKPNKSNAGRPRTNPLVLFKILLLKKLYALSDDSVEYQIRDRLSFMRFLGLDINSPIPDAKTIWAFNNTLAQAKLTEALFEQFNHALHQMGVQLQSGQIIDASFIESPKQRNTREENHIIKQNASPIDWNTPPPNVGKKTSMPAGHKRTSNAISAIKTTST